MSNRVVSPNKSLVEAYSKEEIDALLARVATNVKNGDCNNLWEEGKISFYYCEAQSVEGGVTNVPNGMYNFFLMSMSYQGTDCVQVAFARGVKGLMAQRYLLTEGTWSEWKYHYAMEYDSSSKTLNFLV